MAGGTQFCFGRGEVLEPLSIGEDNLAILLVKFDPNMPEGIKESMRIYPMIMHAVLAILPLIVLFRISSKIK